MKMNIENMNKKEIWRREINQWNKYNEIYRKKINISKIMKEVIIMYVKERK